MVKDLKTLAEFDEEIKKTNLVVIDFTASWCPPCQFIKPKYHDLAKEAEHDTVSFCQVDVDANSEASSKAGIQCMPTFQFYKNGTMLDKMEGADYDSLVKKVKEHK